MVSLDMNYMPLVLSPIPLLLLIPRKLKKPFKDNEVHGMILSLLWSPQKKHGCHGVDVSKRPLMFKATPRRDT